MSALTDRFEAAWDSGAYILRAVVRVRVASVFPFDNPVSTVPQFNRLVFKKDGVVYGSLMFSNPGAKANYDTLTTWAAYSRTMWDSETTTGIFELPVLQPILFGAEGSILAKIHRPGWYAQDGDGNGYVDFYVLVSSSENLTLELVDGSVVTPITLLPAPVGDKGFGFADLHPAGVEAGLAYMYPAPTAPAPVVAVEDPAIVEPVTDYATLTLKLNLVLEKMNQLIAAVATLDVKANYSIELELLNRTALQAISSALSDKSGLISMKNDLRTINDNVISVGDYAVSSTPTYQRRFAELLLAGAVSNLITK